MNIIADNGYYFGLGVFETIAVEQGRPILLDAHYERLERAARFLDLHTSLPVIQKKVEEKLRDGEMKKGRKVLKITVSEENLLVTARKNNYKEEDYMGGFRAEISPVRRNETSPFTYFKTLNYGDCIYEKHRAKKQGVNEPIFINTRGELAEGATTNLFFVRDGKIYTPPVSCGMLPGIMRDYIINHFPVEERVIQVEELEDYDEMFLSNSLLGVMPVRRLGDRRFVQRTQGENVLRMIFHNLFGYPRGYSLLSH